MFFYSHLFITVSPVTECGGNIAVKQHIKKGAGSILLNTHKEYRGVYSNPPGNIC